MSKRKSLGRYIPGTIEKKWRDKWSKEHTYEFKEEAGKETYYNLVELPYPSGDLHLGHWFTFVNADAHARYKKMSGSNVFFPNGFDAFGLPAENAAIKRNIHPQDWTMKNIETMKSQFATMGTMIDWSHEAITCTPSYYKWNQWIFIRMFEKGLAYRGKALSNWCPSCQTVLANEGIEDGKCWRCGSVVVQKEIEQWFLKITSFADSLLWDNTDEGKKANGVEWPKSVREGQNNWIGRSEGASIQFQISNHKSQIEVFTTRPDTLYGVTFLVVAPEHPVIGQMVHGKWQIDEKTKKEVFAYVEAAKEKTEMDRKEQKEKTGVFSGFYAVHPLTSEEIPVWIAEYVLWGYGTGAIMAVPAHDGRDYEFAKKYNLGIKKVIQAKNGQPGEESGYYVGPGTLTHSGDWDGIVVPEGIGKIIEYLSEKKLGKSRVEYHLHDWSVSRQRYWGTPVPMIHCDTCGVVPVPLDELPVVLPYEVDYAPKGRAPLATAESWQNVSCPKCGGSAKREAETLDTFFDSSWYYYRYMDPEYDALPFDPQRAERLMPVDIYFGGAEHTLGHTLYARFFTKFFKDEGLIAFDEFAKKRVQHGIILGPDGFRMSKSRGNVVNPDDVVSEYGADAVRLYLAFMMPFEATAPWNPTAISGIYRFLRRIWELYERVDDSADGMLSKQDVYWMHKTIKKVGEDLREIRFNTAVSSLMEWLNHLSRKEQISLEEYKTLLLLLAPLAPHMTEEIWQMFQIQDSVFKNQEFASIHQEDWPIYDEKFLVQDEVVIVVQVNGKVRENITMESAESKEKSAVEKKAKESEKIKGYLEGKTVKKSIYIEGKILNFVVS
ncbi:MAG: leucyl-tRNA synthetase [Candidatus Parcubacteria bacterium]|jgi:leucyl-tRNA synthetase